MLWECASAASWAEDTGLTDATSYEGWPHEKPAIEPFLRRSIASSPDNTRSRLEMYYNRVEQYTMRDLTFPTDKLPAFSGLASAFRVPELSVYLAGLWEADLGHGLSWMVRGDPTTRYLTSS